MYGTGTPSRARSSAKGARPGAAKPAEHLLATVIKEYACKAKSKDKQSETRSCTGHFLLQSNQISYLNTKILNFAI